MYWGLQRSQQQHRWGTWSLRALGCWPGDPTIECGSIQGWWVRMTTIKTHENCEKLSVTFNFLHRSEADITTGVSNFIHYYKSNMDHRWVLIKKYEDRKLIYRTHNNKSLLFPAEQASSVCIHLFHCFCMYWKQLSKTEFLWWLKTVFCRFNIINTFYLKAISGSSDTTSLLEYCV